MSVLDDVDVQPYFAPYLLANTPLFLFKRFRAIETTRALAERFTPGELVDAFNEHANRHEHVNDDDLVRAYLALTALSFSKRAEAENASQRLRLQRAPWASSILRSALAAPTATAVETMLVSAPRAVIVGPGAPTDNAPVRFELKSAAEQLAANSSPLIIRGGK
jgi:hypothetical protein